MKPVLFAANTNSFTSNGIGVLSDAISCTVTEERNGTFELSMTYPITGEHYAEIMPSAVIRARSTPGGEPQLFRVYSITKPINGVVTVNAEHISYQLSYIPVAPFETSSLQQVLTGIKQNAMTDCPFTFWTDKTTTGNYSQTRPENVRAILGGQAGSILDLYGGEYEFDNYAVKLHNNRGANRGVTLRYGKNITDIEQEENISTTYTGIVGFYEDELSEVHTDVILCDNASTFPYPKIYLKDFSLDFEDIPSVSELEEKARAYMHNNDFGIPKVSIKVSFIALWQTDEYKDIAPLERVYLCDTVTVQFEKLGISANAKVAKTVYNVLLDRYDSIEIGEARTNLSNRIAGQSGEIQEAVDNTKSALEKAIDRATWLITGQKGGYIVIRTNADDKPYELLIMDTDDIATARRVWRFNLSGWGYSSTGINGPYRLAATQDGAINADFITVGTLSASIIKAGVLSDGNGNISWNLSTGEMIAKAISIQSTNFTLDKDGNVTIKKGSININDGVFKVDSLGNLVASKATLTGATITGGTLTVNNADNETIFDLGEDGISWTLANSSMAKNGQFTAKSATLTDVSATGTISTSTTQGKAVFAQGGLTFYDAAGNQAAQLIVDTSGIMTLAASKQLTFSYGSDCKVRFTVRNNGHNTVILEGTDVSMDATSSAEMICGNKGVAVNSSGVSINADQGRLYLTSNDLYVSKLSGDTFSEGYGWTGTKNGVQYINGIAVSG